MEFAFCTYVMFIAAISAPALFVNIVRRVREDRSVFYPCLILSIYGVVFWRWLTIVFTSVQIPA